MRKEQNDPVSLDREEPVAANGLLHRRLFLKGGALFTGDAVGGIFSMNAQTLPRVKMPNRDNFINSYPNRPK